MNVHQEMKEILGENYCKFCAALTFLKCYDCGVSYCTIQCINMDNHVHDLKIKNHSAATKQRVKALLEKSTLVINRRNQKLANTSKTRDIKQESKSEQESETKSVVRPRNVLVFDMVNGKLKHKH